MVCVCVCRVLTFSSWVLLHSAGDDRPATGETSECAFHSTSSGACMKGGNGGDMRGTASRETNLSISPGLSRP